MIQDNISSKAVISKIFRDLNVQQDNWVLSAFEWFGEAIEHIGGGVHFERTLAVLPVSDYKTVLPTGTYSIVQIAYNPHDHKKEPDKNDDLQGMPTTNSNIHPGLYEDTSKIPKAGKYDEHYYYIEENMIKTSYQTGWVVVIYNKIATDDEGYPMVPDHISFKEALFWYVLKKLIMGGKNPRPEVFSYEYADQKWRYYCTQARNSLHMTSIADYEQFRDNWVRLIPDYNRYDNLFDDTEPGVQQYALGTFIDALDALGEDDDDDLGLDTDPPTVSDGTLTVSYVDDDEFTVTFNQATD